MQTEQYQNSIYLMIHRTLTDLSEKITTVVMAMKDISNQIASLNMIVSNPSNQAVLDKISELDKGISNIIDSKVIQSINSNCRDLNSMFLKINENLDDYEKDQTVIKNDIKTLENITEFVVKINKTITKLDEKIDLMRKIAIWFIFTGIPFTFGAIIFIQKISPNLSLQP